MCCVILRVRPPNHFGCVVWNSGLITCYCYGLVNCEKGNTIVLFKCVINIVDLCNCFVIVVFLNPLFGPGNMCFSKRFINPEVSLVCDLPQSEQLLQLRHWLILLVHCVPHVQGRHLVNLHSVRGSQEEGQTAGQNVLWLPWVAVENTQESTTNQKPLGLMEHGGELTVVR